jgi:hypothetical protein
VQKGFRGQAGKRRGGGGDTTGEGVCWPLHNENTSPCVSCSVQCQPAPIGLWSLERSLAALQLSVNIVSQVHSSSRPVAASDSVARMIQAKSLSYKSRGCERMHSALTAICPQLRQLRQLRQLWCIDRGAGRGGVWSVCERMRKLGGVTQLQHKPTKVHTTETSVAVVDIHK